MIWENHRMFHLLKIRIICNILCPEFKTCFELEVNIHKNDPWLLYKGDDDEHLLITKHQICTGHFTIYLTFIISNPPEYSIINKKGQLRILEPK